MSIVDNRFTTSRHARSSLKRGRAREALRDAAGRDADLPAIFGQLREMHPNRKALERAARRLGKQPGVVRVALNQAGLTVMARNVRQATNVKESVELFSEDVILYTTIRIEFRGGFTCYHIGRASFCLHALERLIERSAVPVNRPLLPALDAEFIATVRSFRADAMIADDGEHFLRGVQEGLWAGGIDEIAPEAGWPEGCSKVPIFSVRTFLSPEEMRPTLWLRWKNDASLRMLDQG
ncbi:hypothetical protein [Paracoccus sp. (in: a-proteobacteria)]|uniref:hypothetical protein n=1 Tax=Paracoccus sp. TaxID=267 RepID=UPI003220768A